MVEIFHQFPDLSRHSARECAFLYRHDERLKDLGLVPVREIKQPRVRSNVGKSWRERGRISDIIAKEMRGMLSISSARLHSIGKQSAT